MKKVYIPTQDELLELQELSTNTKLIYQYIFTKTLEVLVLEGVLSPEKGMLKIAYEKFSEYPELAYAICKMYPSEIDKVEEAQYDINLCCEMLNAIHKQDDTIKGLDEILPRFENSLGNRSVIDATTKKLVEHLPSYPQYRFEYKPNSLLDDIFSCEIETPFVSQSSVKNFLVIDPVYITKFSEYHLRNIDKRIETERTLYRYIARYGINENVGRECYSKDIISKPDDKTKKLIRYLEHHKRKYQ